MAAIRATLFGARQEWPDVTTIAAAAKQPSRILRLVPLGLGLSFIVLHLAHG